MHPPRSGGPSEVENQTLTGLELEVFREVEITVCEHILHLGGITYNLRISLHLKGGWLRSAIEHNEGRTSLILTGDDIDTLEGDELGLCAFDDDIIYPDANGADGSSTRTWPAQPQYDLP